MTLEQIQIRNLQDQCQAQSEEIVRLNCLVMDQSAKIALYRDVARRIIVNAGVIVDDER